MESLQIFWVFFAGIFGAVWGSFSAAQVWRIRARQLSSFSKNDLSKEEKAELEKLEKLVDQKTTNDRSRCLNCGYRLKFWDLVPVFSWVFLRGKCRRCHAKIGWMEFLAETFTAGVFASLALFAVFSGLEWWQVAALFLSLLPLVILFLYDAKFSLLPTRVLYAFMAFSTGFFAISNFAHFGNFEMWIKLGVSILSFPAVYWALARFSKERLVGDGDWILALGLILLLPVRPFNGVILMFISNIFALLGVVIAAAILKKRIGRGVQIPFGPAMILAAVFLIFVAQIIDGIFGFLV